MAASLISLRHGLLRLHKTLLDWERNQYELVHGPQRNTAVLAAFFQDPQFAWLRPMSQLIVRIDEMLADKVPPGNAGTDVQTVIAQLEVLITPDESGSEYARRLHTALRENRESVDAHRDLVTLLNEGR